VRRLAANARFTAILALSIAAAVAVYLGLGRHKEPRNARETSDARGAAPAVARVPQWPAATMPPVGTRPQPVAPESNAAGGATSQPDLTATPDKLSRGYVRGFVERVFKGKLADRELTPDDYERLVDAVMRLHSALRVLRGTGESPANAAALGEQREAVVSAFTDIEAITGVRPEDLGDVLASEDLTGAENLGAKGIAPSRSP
jgi:hypothetical protein